jgi:uncharacterized protein (UPF0335 family)
MSKTNFAKDQLKSIVERIERIDGEVAALGEDRKEIFVEAKGNGFDVKSIRRIVRLRKKDKAVLATEADMDKLYMQSIGDDRADIFG